MDVSSRPKFRGEFEHAVDDKGRLIVPLEFRAGLGEEFVAVRSADRAVSLYPKSSWEDFETALDAPDGASILATLDYDTVFLQRMLSTRTFVRPDPQFRLAIPKPLREWSGISQNNPAVILGLGPKVEIWSKDNWDRYNSRFTSENVDAALKKNGAARGPETSPQAG